MSTFCIKFYGLGVIRYCSLIVLLFKMGTGTVVVSVRSVRSFRIILYYLGEIRNRFFVVTFADEGAATVVVSVSGL